MKRLVLLVVCLLMTVGAYAQEIVGRWVQEERQAENGMEMAITETFTISKDGTFEQGVVMEIRMSDAQKAAGKGDKKANGQAAGNTDQTLGSQKAAGQKSEAVRVRISCKGGWTLAAGVLTQTLDAKSIRTEVLEQPEGFPKFFVNMLSKTVSSEFKKQSKKPDRSKVITLTADKLVLQSLDPKDSETTTYTRGK